jgi:hypothetical protein
VASEDLRKPYCPHLGSAAQQGDAPDGRLWRPQVIAKPLGARHYFVRRQPVSPAAEAIMSRCSISALALVVIVSACGRTQDSQVAVSDSGSVADGGARLGLSSLVHGAPHLSLKAVEFSVHPPSSDWRPGSISWIAADQRGLIYLFQRGDDRDPFVVVARDGRVVRSWGKGRYIMPHAIRIDPQGNIWTVDAATSMASVDTQNRPLIDTAKPAIN